MGEIKKLKLSEDSVLALLQLFLKCTFEQLNMQDEISRLEITEHDGKLWICNPPQTITVPNAPSDVLCDEEDEE